MKNNSVGVQGTRTIDSASDVRSPASTSFNIASHLPRMARIVPHQAAVIVPERRGNGYVTMSFAELEALSNRYANSLVACGITSGTRVLLMVRPGFDFVALVFALFKMGAVPVMIDPGMGVARLLDCIRTVDPDALIGIPIAHVMRVLRRSAFQTVQRAVTVGRRWFWGGPTLQGLSRHACDRFTMLETGSDQVAAILFTSGSTGPAKGVVYEHGMFGAQVRAIQKQYGIEPGEVDLGAFPLFTLFSIAMGMTSVIPDMDPSHPARVDPKKIIRPIQDHHVTSTFGSPAIWTKVAAYCVKHKIKLPSLKRVLIAGAPVSYRTIETLHHVLGSAADVHTPYGATESLPVCSISGREIPDGGRNHSRTGAGTCVGRPLPQIELGIIRITDDPIEQWSNTLLVPDGRIGEIVVAGEVVTKEYFHRSADTRLAKIRDGNRIRHRIGDVGYRDDQGRIWFCGRKSQRVVTEHGTLFTVCCEAVFNEHPRVLRTALVGVGPRGRQRPVIVVEPIPQAFPPRSRREAFRKELLTLGRANELTRGINDILFRRTFPVDIRHNAKINREALAAWAARRLP